MTAYFNQVNKLQNNLAARKLEKRIFKYFLKSNQMMTCKSLALEKTKVYVTEIESQYTT